MTAKKMSKAVLISIKPEWCEKIIDGKKTVEIRKTKPKLETPFKCYIYQTKGKEKMIDIIKDGDDCYGETYHGKPVFIKMREDSRYAGLFGREQKVIGEFVCDGIIEFPYNANGYGLKAEKTVCTLSGVPVKELYHYLQGKKPYGWHISNLKIYDKPREISRFGLKRAPQSWCYVE